MISETIIIIKNTVSNTEIKISKITESFSIINNYSVLETNSISVTIIHGNNYYLIKIRSDSIIIYFVQIDIHNQILFHFNQFDILAGNIIIFKFHYSNYILSEFILDILYRVSKVFDNEFN